MKKAIVTVLFIATTIGSFFLGATQAKTVEITKEKEIEVPVIQTREIIPEGYIPLDDCIPLEDVAISYVGESGYICFEIKDTRYQLDNPQNRSYVDIMSKLERNYN